jgi:hypothetical protein
MGLKRRGRTRRSMTMWWCRLKEAAKAEGMAEGMIAEGIAESILEVLEARGIAVSPARREEILGCSDVDRLRRWLREATTEAASRD